MGIFGPSTKEIWKELSEEINAKYIDRGIFSSPRIEYKHKDRIIYLDQYTVATANSAITYTRIRIPFINNNKFDFRIYNRGIFSNIGKALGMQDIEIGYDKFDDDYIIKSNDETFVKKLLFNVEIRNLIQIQPKIKLHIKKLNSTTDNHVSELLCEETGVIKDKARLKNLIKLFSAIIDQFEENGITNKSIPQVQLYKK